MKRPRVLLDDGGVAHPRIEEIIGVGQYPELDKMKAAREKSAILSDFLDWMNENGIRLCRNNPDHYWAKGGEYYQITESYEQLLAQYFNIDLNKVEEERRRILDEQRALNERAR